MPPLPLTLDTTPMKLEHVLMLTARLRQELGALSAASPTPIADISRWAFFVSPKELNELMDEAMAAEEFKHSMTEKEQKDIREERAMWHLNGIFILPELQNEVEKLNG